MAKEVKVFNGTGTSGVIYTVPAGRVAKATLGWYNTSTTSAASWITAGSVTWVDNNISGGASVSQNKSQYMTNSTDNVQLNQSQDCITIGNSVGGGGLNILQFSRYIFLQAGQTISVSNATYSISVVEEY